MAHPRDHSAAPQLRFTADISHWVVVSERLLDDPSDDFSAFIDRVHHVQAQVGYDRGRRCRTRRRLISRRWLLPSASGSNLAFSARLPADHAPSLAPTAICTICRSPTFRWISGRSTHGYARSRPTFSSFYRSLNRNRSHDRRERFTELPTIDIRDLAGDDLAGRQAVADAIGRAAREVGFFYITGHGIDPALIAVRRRRSRSSPCRWRRR